ncbi:unnamed protein product, partial [Prorocentrum cordatum]
ECAPGGRPCRRRPLGQPPRGAARLRPGTAADVRHEGAGRRGRRGGRVHGRRGGNGREHPGARLGWPGQVEHQRGGEREAAHRVRAPAGALDQALRAGGAARGGHRRRRRRSARHRLPGRFHPPNLQGSGPIRHAQQGAAPPPHRRAQPPRAAAEARGPVAARGRGGPAAGHRGRHPPHPLARRAGHVPALGPRSHRPGGGRRGRRRWGSGGVSSRPGRG